MSLNRHLLLAAVGITIVFAGVCAGVAVGQERNRLQPDAKSGELIAARQAIAAAVTPVTDAMLKNPSPNDWLQWRRTYDEQGFSPLTQINKRNAATLRPAWTWSLIPGTGEIVPLVHDGVMYVYGKGDHVQALDATNGDLLWEYVNPAGGAPWPGAAGTYRKNFALYGDKLVFPTDNSHEIALDIHTGKVVWDHMLADLKTPYRASSGALAVDGKLIQGMTNCSRLQPGGCVVIALDANSGNEVWRFHTIARDGEPGGDTWNNLPLEKRQGASVWTTPSYDPELNLVFVGTGNTYDWQDLVGNDTARTHAKDGLYADSTLALKPATGEMVWHYQHLPQDIWDLDFAFDRQIVTLPVGGKPEKLVVTTGKTMITDAVDAATGKWVFSDQVPGLQNIVKSIDPRTGEKTYDPQALYDLSGARAALQCPMDNGGKDWPSNGYDPKTHLMYITMAEDCTEVRPRKFTAADPYAGGGQEISALKYLPGSDGKIGRMMAVDLVTHKTVWTVRQRATLTTAALVTAGGLLFVGDSDRWFRAYDAATGKVLWAMRLNDAINSFPISYSVHGKQYIAIAAGMGGPQIRSYMPLTPEIESPRGGGGAQMWVFELPGKNGT